MIGSYARSPQLANCIGILLDAGGVTMYDAPAVLDLLRGRLDRLAEHLHADPSLVHRRFPELDFGATGTRRLTLKGATLLHMAAEYGNVEAARLLLDRGADLSIRAKLPGHYERPEEVLECTPLGYARLFPEGSESQARFLLRDQGAVE